MTNPIRGSAPVRIFASSAHFQSKQRSLSRPALLLAPFRKNEHTSIRSAELVSGEVSLCTPGFGQRSPDVLCRCSLLRCCSAMLTRSATSPGQEAQLTENDLRCTERDRPQCSLANHCQQANYGNKRDNDTQPAHTPALQYRACASAYCKTFVYRQLPQ